MKNTKNKSTEPFFSRCKRILAILGCLLLVCLYLSTLIFALMDSPDAFIYLKASVYATVVVPALLWAYSFIYKLLKSKEDSDKE